MDDEHVSAAGNPLSLDTALHSAPTIFVDGAQGFASNAQIVKFNLYQDALTGEVDPQAPIHIQRVICARLVMSPQVLKELAAWLNKYALMMFPDGS